jgi:prephenate dehydrogenase
MPPAEHDRLLARTSHLGHLVAAVLAATVNRGAADEVRGFCGTGFRDTTRVASGPEDVWHDIVSTNRQAVAEELGRFGQTLDGVRKMILAGDFEGVRGFLAAARRQREELLSRGESA